MEEGKNEQEVMQDAGTLKKETIDAVQEERNERKFTPLGQINEPAPKKKKSKAGGIIFILILLLAIIGALAYYYFQVYTNPKVVYQQILKSGISSATETQGDMETLKARAKLDMEIDLNEMYMEDGVKEILDLINNIDATVEMQMDTNEKKAVLKLDSNYENETLLNMDMLFDVKNKETYVKLEQFFDNILEVEIEDEYYEELDTALEIEEETSEQKLSKEKATEIINAECEKMIKDEYCSKEKEKITINSEEINADKYILKMTYSEFMDEVTTTLENLKDNEEFLSCFEEKEDKKESLEEAIEEIESRKLEEEATLCVNLYKKGLKQEFVRVDFEIEADGEKLILKVEKVEDTYKFQLTFEGKTYCSGTIKTEQLDDTTVKLNLELDVEEIGTIALNMEYGYVVNEAIETMDTENAVSMEELSMLDISKAYTNLQNSKLYELIEKFSSLSDDSITVDDEQIEIPSSTDNNLTSDAENNISVDAALAENGKLIVFVKNNNTVPVDIDIEVEYYDADGKFLGSSSDYLMAVGTGIEGAMEMWETPAVFDNYKIYTDVEISDEIEYFDQVEMTHNNNGQNVVVQVKNNSEDTIDYITVAVVYYNQGEVVGIEDGIASEVKPGRSGNFTLDFPCDSNYDDVEFDDYKVLVTEAYSYNW